MSSTRLYFENLYGSHADPYGVGTRWYEARKRAVLLSALPARRFGSAYEPGCGIGELTVELAGRCDRVLASDFQQAAVEATRQRTANLPQVQVLQQQLPADWPTPNLRHGDSFDLIVLSELGYFLDAAEMHTVAQRCQASLAPDGTLVACDWRRDFRERKLPTETVHQALGHLGLTPLVRHEEPDFLLQVWCRDPRSVAQREGIG